MRRPLGFTILALVLGWCAIAGVGLAYWAVISPAPQYVRLALAAVGLVYGVSAGVSALALWRNRSWAERPLWVWAVACLASTNLPYLLTTTKSEWWMAPLGTAVFAAILAVILRNVHVRLPRPT